ncbi:MAG: cytochrome C oxidase subunit IV family protein [Ignavibacteriales bacterium]|nr:cytochrome C oxidase subunit IV family protein [Ignavibacteriales bacterium]
MSNKESHTHIVGYGTYVFIWLTLLALTALTVTVSGIHFGNITLLIAIIIAIVKAGLVLNIFMHIKYDDVVFKVFVIVGTLTLVAIIVLTFSDYLFR